MSISSTFYAHILGWYFGTKNFKPKTQQFLAPKFCMKNAHIKSWWNWRQVVAIWSLVWLYLILKIWPSVNFINILRTNFFVRTSFLQFFYVHVTREKLPKQHSYEKFVCKMLMKLTKVDVVKNIKIFVIEIYNTWLLMTNTTILSVKIL